MADIDIIESSEKTTWSNHVSNKSNPHNATADQVGAAPKKNGVFYIKGTGTTEGVWLGTHSGITEYYEGLMIIYKIPIAGVTGGTTLNINNLGAVSVVRLATSALTTHYPVDGMVHLIYTVDSSGTAYWKVPSDYDSNTKNTAGTTEKAGTKLFLAGATSQGANPQTYSNAKVYIGTDDSLYSNGTKVSVEGHAHAAGDITSGTLSVARGGTGATTFTSGAALIGAGTGAVTTRSITNNTAASTAVPANTNLITANTLRYALNRTTATTAADTNYSTAMVRAIQASTTDLTAGSSSLTSGLIYLVYE